MKHTPFHACLLCLVAAFGCDGKSSPSAAAREAQYERQQNEAARQLKENQRQLELGRIQQQDMGLLLERWAKQADQYDELLQRWEHQGDRIDQLLEGWQLLERQPPDSR